jgi:hypothetical protein
MRRICIVLAGLVAVIAVGIIVARSTAGDSTAVAVGLPRSPDVLEVGGPDPDVAPARAAAVRAVSLTGDVVAAGLISRRVLIESFSTPRFGPMLADRTSSAVDGMLLQLGERNVDTTQLQVREQPVTADAEAAGAGVRVRLWSVLVVAAPGTGPARQLWRTVTLDMVDVAGRWLVDAWSSTPGPTPAPAPEASFDDAATLAPLLAWPAAVTTGAS